MEMNTVEPLLDACQAAQILNIHPKTVKRLSAEGVIPGMRIGKLWRYRASTLDEWAASQINCSRHPFHQKEVGQ
jgi:excisionase family DNA binding protein